jgi:hypothetical protein
MSLSHKSIGGIMQAPPKVKDVKEGFVGTTSQGDQFVVLETLPNNKCLIQFLDKQKHKRVANKNAVTRGNVKNPFRVMLYGVGYIGDGKHTSVTSRRQYNIWQGMLERCYSEAHPHHKHYEDVTVCEEWHNFQNFADWCLTQEGFKDKYFEIDKDFMVTGNRLYSPKTCCFIPTVINSFFLNGKGLYKKDKSLGTGVTETPSGTFRASLNKVKLGSFPSQRQAEVAFTNYKKYSLWLLATEFKDRLDNSVYERLLELSTPTWKDFVVDQQTYEDLISTGMAFVWYPDLPLSWKAAKEEIDKYQMSLNEEDK